MVAREVPDKFLVAFSLAGEQRQLVEAIAAEVERRLGKATVFYDEWYEHYIAGADADLKLQEIYAERCDLAVACISSQYGDKHWTQAEHAAIRARYMQATGNPAERDSVLLVRVGDGDVPGILFNAIVPDLRERSVEAAARLVTDRLALVRPATTAARQPAVDWPHEPPQLRWPMADHGEARAAFGALLTESSEVRLLCIAGPSDTGKSHMAAQMLANCMRLPGMRAGRFDFKGTTEMAGQLTALVRSLEVDEPPEGPLNARLGSVLSQLKRLAKPTALILDTYEQAGEATRWVEYELLTELIRAPWLRVVILGQADVPHRNGAWEPVSGSPIRLRHPEPEDWWEYTKRQRPDEQHDLDFVTKVHDCADGRPSILASLLGPR